jgi:hypothetical protein
MTIYTAYQSAISPSIMVTFGSIAFIFSVVEIILDQVYPNEQVRHGDKERQGEMDNKEGG